MAQSFARSVASGLTANFSIPFPFLDRSHVTVLLNSTETTAFTWLTDGEIQLNAVPLAGTLVERRRQTPTEPIVAFQSGNLDTEDLNAADRQSLYLAQEADDDAADALARGWYTVSSGAGGTIQKGTNGQYVRYDESGNMVPAEPPSGSGNMSTGIYDPTGRATDAFDSANHKYAPGFPGTVARSVRGKLIEACSVVDFFLEGEEDDTEMFRRAATFAAAVQRAGSANNDIVSARVRIPAGVYNVVADALDIIRNGVHWVGDGSGSVCILVNGSGDKAIYVDDVAAPTGKDYSNVYLAGFTLENNGTVLDGLAISGLIRNCFAHDVVVKKFRDSWSVRETWTFVLDQCCSYNVTRHHVNAGAGTGGFHMYGGRYDVAADKGIYVEDPAAELIMVDVAVQFGSNAAVWVEDARTVYLALCFFEGNCIGNPASHYVHLSRIGSNALSSATVIDCVMNDLADTNRRGLGCLYVENYRSFKYRERWVRNGVSAIPEVGTGVDHRDITFNNAGSRSGLLTGIAPGSAFNAVVKQTARPLGLFGQDMADVSFAPTTRAAVNIGQDSVGVALGTYSSVGALNGYGAAGALHVNPGNGEIRLGQGGSTIAAGTNEFFGRLRHAIQITSSNIIPAATTSVVFVNTSGGPRTVTLSNIAHTAGRQITVKKTDGGANQLIVSPGTPGGNIDGAATWSSTAAYASVTLCSDGTNWFVI